MKRIAYILFLIGTTVLVSFRGGNIPYLLFYFALLLPVLALIYSVYVYTRFKISQDVERDVIKAQKVPYSLVLANEDLIPFSNITLNYFTDRVTIAGQGESDSPGQGQKRTDNLCLLSKQKILVDTKMYCKYRGTYPVGVKSVSVTDFLGLFTITYPLKEQVRLTARPRIIPLEQLAAGLKQRDPKNSLFSFLRTQDLPDYEVRQYQPGDAQKYIHWKNSARAGELLVRKQMPEELFEIAIIMDLSPVEGDMEKRLRTEDSIIEAAISFAHHYYLKKIPVRIVYMDKEIREIVIDARTGFDRFYKTSANIIFQSVLGVERVWAEYEAKSPGNRAVVLITSAASGALLDKLEENSRIGKEAVLINAGELSL